MSRRKFNRDWLHLLFPAIVLAGLVGAYAAVHTKKDTTVKTAPSPGSTPVLTGRRTTAEPAWVKLQISEGMPGCIPAYTSPDRTQPQQACFPDGVAVVSLSQEQNGMSAIKYWSPSLPAIDPKDTPDWQKAKDSKDTGVLWVDTKALEVNHAK